MFVSERPTLQRTPATAGKLTESRPRAHAIRETQGLPGLLVISRRFETRSLPNSLVTTLATLPSISEIPFLDSPERPRGVGNCASAPIRLSFWRCSSIAVGFRAHSRHQNNRARLDPDRTSSPDSSLSFYPAILAYVSISAAVD